MTLAEIVAKVAIVLRDVGHVRSTQPEIEGWVYAGQVEAAEMRPDLFAEEAVVDLVAGARQRAPSGTIAILNVLGNSDVTGATLGRTATETDARLMDHSYPGWRGMTPTATFKQWMRAADDVIFDVYPPNDGTGYALVSLASVPASTGEPTLPAEYHMALVDYAVGRALSKDSKDELAAGRAAGSYAAFKEALAV